MSSRMIMDSADLCASSKTLAISEHLEFSEKPTIDSAEMILMKGKEEEMPNVAAKAVLPAPAGPSRSAVSNGVFSEFFT